MEHVEPNAATQVKSPRRRLSRRLTAASPRRRPAAAQEALCERGRVEDDLVKQADATSIAAVMECEEVHDHLVTVLPAVFGPRRPALPSPLSAAQIDSAPAAARRSRGSGWDACGAERDRCAMWCPPCVCLFVLLRASESCA